MESANVEIGHEVRQTFKRCNSKTNIFPLKNLTRPSLKEAFCGLVGASGQTIFDLRCRLFICVNSKLGFSVIFSHVTCSSSLHIY